MSLLEGLNPAQAAAVTHPGGPLLVLAGAGSGKTRVLTHRVAYLIGEQGVPPYGILAITFTNKAAREMRERIDRLLPERAAEIWVFTFHAACLRILRREIGHLGYSAEFVIYDQDDSLTVIKDCLREMDLDPKRYPPGAFRHAISWHKNRLVGPSQLSAAAGDYFEELTARVYFRYQERLEANNALDFDDLLGLTVRLFEETPAVLERYQHRFRHLLVDEYQDTNHAQYTLVRMLARQHRNLSVVGDPDQSIYKWRGADIRNILDFERDYPDATVILLEQNYRSTGRILAAANQIIAHNSERKDKRLWTAAGEGEPIGLARLADEAEEARTTAERIRWLHFSENRSYNDFAVLYRTHAQSRVLEEVFLRSGIPYTIVGGLRFYERKEIKDLLAYLRLIVNPADEVSLARVINVPRRGVGQASLLKFFAFVRERMIPAGLALERAEEIEGLSSRVRRAMAELGEKLAAWRARRDEGGAITALAREVLESTGYRAELTAERSVEAETRLENLAEFLSVTAEFDASRGGTLAEFLGDLALVTDLDQLDEGADRVTLMTLHSAKGLEFPVVFLTGMEEGVFPHSRALDEPAELEEERRLCYVGVTRARERLFLSCCERRRLYGVERYNTPSRFLDEIPPDLLRVEGGDRGEPLDLPRPTAASSAGGVRETCRTFRIGDKVRHQKWGEGTVVRVTGEGEEARVTVAFPGLGVKELLVKYAPLAGMN
ncbi:MAG: DNA helicase PcrA [Thermoanaerobacterales bacterium]|nr:DNA helicase PcrA [Thermoanaerobacterales bacterium]